MPDTMNPEVFEEIVEWAYSTLPQKIRDLPDFPGIQVVDEPPADVLRDIANKRKWRAGTELLGLYSGVHRTERQHNLVRTAPDLIFVFRGPILRCLKGDLRAEVKQVVWHEVAHWLGHDEKGVEELGLSVGGPDIAHHSLSEEPETVLQSQLPESNEEQPRCIKCYSADLACRELYKPMTNPASWLGDPVSVRVKICTCNSCGYEWDDADDN
jgi:predicted Zn-dependent protease with MMP-like domain